MSQNLGVAENFKTPEKSTQGVRRNLELEFRMCTQDDVICVSTMGGNKKRVTPILVRHYLAEGTALNPIVID